MQMNPRVSNRQPKTRPPATNPPREPRDRRGRRIKDIRQSVTRFVFQYMIGVDCVVFALTGDCVCADWRFGYSGAMSFAYSNDAVRAFVAALHQLDSIPLPVPPYPDTRDPDTRDDEHDADEPSPPRVELDVAILHALYARLPSRLQQRIASSWMRLVELLNECRQLAEHTQQLKRGMVGALTQGIVDELLQVASPTAPTLAPLALVAHAPPLAHDATWLGRPAVPPVDCDPGALPVATGDRGRRDARQTIIVAAATAACVSVLGYTATVALTLSYLDDPRASQPDGDAPARVRPVTTPASAERVATRPSLGLPDVPARAPTEHSSNAERARVTPSAPVVTAPANGERAHRYTHADQTDARRGDGMRQLLLKSKEDDEFGQVAADVDLIVFARRGQNAYGVQAMVDRGHWVNRSDVRMHFFIDNKSEQAFRPARIYLAWPDGEPRELELVRFRPAARGEDSARWIIPAGQVGRGEVLVRDASKRPGQSATLVLEQPARIGQIRVNNLVFQ